jgi:hypothetical protein
VTNSSAIQNAIADYIRSGEADALYGAWPGDWLEKAERGRRELREALLTAGHHSVGEMVVAPSPAPDTVAMPRTKVGPMVRGLFPRDEHEVVVNALERSVVFVAGTNIEALVFNAVSMVPPGHWPTSNPPAWVRTFSDRMRQPLWASSTRRPVAQPRELVEGVLNIREGGARSREQLFARCRGRDASCCS